MAQIDLKECTIKVFDGTLGTLSVMCTSTDNDLSFTAKSRHIGTDKISVTYVDPGGNDESLDVTVTGRDIVVSLATGTAGAIESTAAEIKAAIEADAAANALVTVAILGTGAGAGVVTASAKATLDGQKYIEVKLGEGNLTFTDHRAVEFKLDRGILDSVRSADEQPTDLSVDAMWEYLMAVTGSNAPTIEDVMKRRGEAAAWVSTADDQCQPYCVDIEVHNAVGCTTDPDEIITFEEFYYETVDHDLRDGTLNFSGRCNRTGPTIRRVLAADIA